MYCSHCNKYISDSSKRYCDYCGAYLGNKNIMPTPARNATSMDLPRGDVVNYLYVVKSLECVKAELENRIHGNMQKIEAYRQPVYLPEVKVEKEGETSDLTIPSSKYSRYIDWFLAGMSLVSAIGTFITLMLLCWIFFFGVMIFDRNNDILYSSSFQDTLFYGVVAISIGVLIVGWVLAFLIRPPHNRNNAIKKYNKDLKLNAEILNENQKKQLKFKSDSAAREAKIRQIKKENELKARQEEIELTKNRNILSNIENQLLNAYSLNIIPSQYRTLEAAIYIYDFMATSRETLKDTLFHLDFKNVTEHMRGINRQLLANEAILKSINGSLSSLYCQNREIQRAIEKSNALLKNIKPFDDQNKSK